MKWYADNSELHGIKEAEISDIYLLGGIIIEEASERELRKRVQEIKQEFLGAPFAPVKWNFKELLQKFYEPNKRRDVFEKGMASSKEWKSEMFKAIAAVECSLMISVIESYSAKRGVLKDKKQSLSQYVFSNGLMRFALHVSDTKPESASVVLDWPDKGERDPFDEEYARAYAQGKSAEKNKYMSGALQGLAFTDAILYSNALTCSMLQISDLVVGATREFVECALDKKSTGFGVDCLRCAREKIRGAPSKILQRGIIVPGRNEDLLDRVRNSVQKLLFDERHSEMPPGFG